MSDQQIAPAIRHKWLTRAREIMLKAGMDDASITWLAYTHNVVFDVRQDERRYVLRLHPHGAIALAQVRGEAAWLHHLAANGLAVPAPVAFDDGDFTLKLPDDDVTGVLFHYVHGESLSPEHLTPEHLHRIGAFIARMHHLAADYTPPPDSRRPRLDAEGLFGEDGIYHPGEAIRIFTPQQQTIMQQATTRVTDLMQSLDTDSEHDHRGMIHGDLLLKNLLFAAGHICALDFEYCGPGYFLYDLTPLLWQLKATAPDYATLEDALWQGYVEVRPLPQVQRSHLETFIVARQVASMRWLANNLEHPAIKTVALDLIAQRTDELRGFLETGTLKRHSITL